MLSRLLLGGLLTAAIASAGDLGGIMAFGDSLSDAGNVYILANSIPGGSQYAPNPPAYGNHEFTDGSDSSPSTTGPLGVWVDQLAPKLGLVKAAPSLAGGTNFAYGDAQVLQNAVLGLIPSVDSQVNMALSAFHSSLPSNYLYTFWAGANDLAANPSLATAKSAADNIESEIKTMAGDGAKDFVWLDLPPLGETPGILSKGAASVAAANALSAAFDAEWFLDVQALLGMGIDVIPVDVNGLFTKIIADFDAHCSVGPSDPFCFANISQPAQGQNVDPNTYLFWDSDHPTTAADALVADAAAAAVDAALAPIPEPVTIAFASLGLIAVSFAGRRRKFFRN